MLLVEFEYVFRQADDHGDLAVPLLFHVSFDGFLYLVNWVPVVSVRVVESATICVGFVLFFAAPQVFESVALDVFDVAWCFVADERAVLGMSNFDGEVELFGFGFFGSKANSKSVPFAPDMA